MRLFLLFSLVLVNIQQEKPANDTNHTKTTLIHLCYIQIYKHVHVFVDIYNKNQLKYIYKHLVHIVQYILC